MDSKIDTGQIVLLEKQLYEMIKTRENRMKVAMLIAKTFGKNLLYSEKLIDAALAKVATRNDVEAFGNISNWRFSEIRWMKS